MFFSKQKSYNLYAYENVCSKYALCIGFCVFQNEVCLIDVDWFDFYYLFVGHKVFALILICTQILFFFLFLFCLNIDLSAPPKCLEIFVLIIFSWRPEYAAWKEE